ncbi:MAG TPA: HAD-IA family hydrolase [Actinocrinis sp.]
MNETEAVRAPALIFDCDGVLADTERHGHLPAFNAAFEHFGLPVHWSDAEYARLVRIGGGKERMRTLITPSLIEQAGLPDDPALLDEQVASWHKYKTGVYTSIIESGDIPARPGIRRLAAEAAQAGWALAVASTSAEAAVRSVLQHTMGPQFAQRFSVFAGDVVPRKKPAPDIYLHAVERLGADPGSCVVVEDSRNGLTAALEAGLACVVTPSGYTGDEDFTGAALVVSSLGEPGGDGRAAAVLADPYGLDPRPAVRLAHLEALLGRLRRSQPSTTPSDRRS